MSIVLQSSGGGSITIAEPATASNFTQTLPAASGTVQVSGNQPAFSAYQSSAQSVTNNTTTKIQFQTEDFDTNNNFDNATNYRFTPTVAGYYQLSAGVTASTTTSNTVISLYKNGSNFKYISIPATNCGATLSSLVFFNGSTDYAEVYVYLTGTTPTVQNGTAFTWFNGSMVRSA